MLAAFLNTLYSMYVYIYIYARNRSKYYDIAYNVIDYSFSQLHSHKNWKLKVHVSQTKLQTAKLFAFTQI